tara:strand:+ start:82 stop:198 length:117 start_codon:yes stop_codon:yes gene_type:complete
MSNALNVLKLNLIDVVGVEIQSWDLNNKKKESEANNNG